jgi:hypothetical protein
VSAERKVVHSYHVYHVKPRKMNASSSDNEHESSDSPASQDESEHSVEITQERLDNLFEAAKAAMIRKGKQKHVAEDSANADGEEIINITGSSSK